MRFCLGDGRGSYGSHRGRSQSPGHSTRRIKEIPMQHWQKFIWILSWAGNMATAQKAHVQSFGAFTLLGASMNIVNLEVAWPWEERYHDVNSYYVKKYKS